MAASQTRPKCFVHEPLKNPVELIDVLNQTEADDAQAQPPIVRQGNFADKASLATYLNNAFNKEDYACRYISICQRNSWQPLQITEDMLELIMASHGLDISLWDLTTAFYSRSLKIEQVFCIPYREYRSGSFIDISYTIRYPEYKPDNDEWTIRQTGIYHRFNTKTAQSTLLSFNPTPNSKLDCKTHKWLLQQVEQATAAATAAANQNSSRQGIKEAPFWLHQKLFETYVPAWREYIASLERRFLPIANTASATYINEELRLGHTHLTTLIGIEKDFMQISTMLAATMDVLMDLNSLACSPLFSRIQQQQPPHTQEFKNLQRQCELYSRTAAHLQERVQVTAQLLSDTLLFRDQVLAKEQNGNMLQLNRSAVFLTTLTLLYLPASFLTSFFGMNFFALNQQDNKIVATPMIWIFVISAIFLTIATFALYNWLAHHDTVVRKIAPQKWISVDIKLSSLRRRLTGSRTNDSSNHPDTGV